MCQGHEMGASIKPNTLLRFEVQQTLLLKLRAVTLPDVRMTQFI